MSRWILITRDRVDADDFPPNKLLAQMLGVRRPTVSLAGSAPQRAGLFARHVAHNNLGPPAAQELSCECYEYTRSEFERDPEDGPEAEAKRRQATCRYAGRHPQPCPVNCGQW